MTIREITVSTSHDQGQHLLRRLTEAGAKGLRMTAELQASDRVSVSFLAGQKTRQNLLDIAQSVLPPDGDWRITLTPVETTIPFPSDEEDTEAEKDRSGPGGLSREEIYNAVWANARLDRNYLLMVLLSTVVAAFGMIADTPAVVVGAMVIAPLLGPNLAFAVGVALGDGRLMSHAARTNLAGLVLALGLAVLIGLIWPVNMASAELIARANVGFDGMAIALASGAAAALSLVTGVSAVLVGVMVAVALLPPTAAVGIFLGNGAFDAAIGAALLLAVNVTCINLAAQAVLLVRGITPRFWFEKRRARRASRINAVLWLGLLVLLAGLLWLRLPVLS